MLPPLSMKFNNLRQLGLGPIQLLMLSSLQWVSPRLLNISNSSNRLWRHLIPTSSASRVCAPLSTTSLCLSNNNNNHPPRVRIREVFRCPPKKLASVLLLGQDNVLSVKASNRTERSSRDLTLSVHLQIPQRSTAVLTRLAKVLQAVFSQPTKSEPTSAWPSSR